MRSFGILSIAAAAAFSLFVAAAPVDLPKVPSLLGDDKKDGSDSGQGAGGDKKDDSDSSGLGLRSVYEVTKRDDDDLSVPKILKTLGGAVEPVLEDIEKLTSGSAIESTVEDLLKEITDALNEAIKDVKTLVGKTVEEILASVDDDSKQDDIGDVAKEVVSLLQDILKALVGLIKIIDKSIISDVLSTIGQLLSELIQALCDLIDGLLDAILSLVKDLLDDIVELAFDVLKDLLKL